MAVEFQSSFIPKQTTPTHQRGGVDFFFLIAVIILLGTAAFAGGLIVYRQYVQQSIESLKQSLATDKDAYEPDFISQATRLNSRIEVTKTLLKKHIAVSELFKLLETYTIDTVALRNLKYSTDADGSIHISADGLARDYPAIVAQSDQYGKSRFLKDLIFSGLNVGTDGLVAFTLEATVDPELVRFENSDSLPGSAPSPSGAATTTGSSRPAVEQLPPATTTTTAPATNQPSN